MSIYAIFSCVYMCVCVYIHTANQCCRNVSNLCGFNWDFFCYLQNFKREEQNFVVQNEINNMSFLITDTKSKMSKVILYFTVVPCIDFFFFTFLKASDYSLQFYCVIY